MKIVSLSFDDGTIYDLRFIELLNKYNLKATLNLNSELNDFVWYYDDQHPIKRLDLKEVKEAYNGHEVASHSLTHPYFSSLEGKEVIRQVKNDVENLSKIFGYNIEGFAFPFHDQTEENIQTIKDNVDLAYIRYSYLDHSGKHMDRYHIHINALYDDEDIYDRLEEFKKEEENSLFVIAGHAYEFEVKNDWGKIERLLKHLANDKDVVVLTLKEAVRVLENKTVVSYPTIFEKDDEYYNVTVPDIFGGVTCGKGYHDAVYMAKDMIKLMLKEAPGQCFPSKTLEETQRNFPDKLVIMVEVEV